MVLSSLKDMLLSSVKEMLLSSVEDVLLSSVKDMLLSSVKDMLLQGVFLLTGATLNFPIIRYLVNWLRIVLSARDCKGISTCTV